MWSESQWHCHYFLTSLVIVIRFFLGHVFILLGRLLRSDSLGQKLGALQLAPLRIFGVIGDFRASSFENSNCLIFGIWLKNYFRTHSSTSGPKFFVSLVSGCKRYRTWSNVLSLTSLLIVIRFFSGQVSFFKVGSLG